jgi:hypothetical protein
MTQISSKDNLSGLGHFQKGPSYPIISLDYVSLRYLNGKFGKPMHRHMHPTTSCTYRAKKLLCEILSSLDLSSKETDADLQKAISALPAYFACDFDNLEPPPRDSKSMVFYWEKIIINLSGQSRLMRLHRPWLSRGYKDKA